MGARWRYEPQQDRYYTRNDPESDQKGPYERLENTQNHRKEPAQQIPKCTN